MKELISHSDILPVLERYEGAYAQIWKFNISHKKLVIRFSFSFEEENLYLLCIGCEFISGPFSWDNCRIRYATGTMRDLNGDLLSSVTDEVANFELIISGDISFFLVNENENNFLEDF